MEILKYNKLDAGKYDIYLSSGDVITLFDDTIFYFELLLKKEIDDNMLVAITEFNDSLRAYYDAIKYLSKKMRSRLEVENFLLKKDYNEDLIEITIDKLIDEGYLDKKKYICSYISDQINLTNNGPLKIKRNLVNLGFKEEDIIIDYDFSHKLKCIIDKKVKINQKLNENSLKLSLSNYLVGLGYPSELFISLLDDIRVDNNSIIKKDYEKLYNKYQYKYRDKKLESIIKEKLYKKGYNIDEINEVMYD